MYIVVERVSAESCNKLAILNEESDVELEFSIVTFEFNNDPLNAVFCIFFSYSDTGKLSLDSLNESALIVVIIGFVFAFLVLMGVIS